MRVSGPHQALVQPRAPHVRPPPFARRAPRLEVNQRRPHRLFLPRRPCVGAYERMCRSCGCGPGFDWPLPSRPAQSRSFRRRAAGRSAERRTSRSKPTRRETQDRQKSETIRRQTKRRQREGPTSINGRVAVQTEDAVCCSCSNGASQGAPTSQDAVHRCRPPPSALPDDWMCSVSKSKCSLPAEQRLRPTVQLGRRLQCWL